MKLTRIRPARPRPATRARITYPGLETKDVTTWREKALCQSIDPEVFFDDESSATSEAKTICAVCVTSQQCLRYALDNNEQYGVWGGFTAAERRMIRRETVLVARSEALEPAVGS